MHALNDLRKTLEARLPVILVINKVDRADARSKDVIDEVYELFLDLDADHDQIQFPIVYADARAGWASTESDVVGTSLQPLFELLVEHIPAPTYEDGHPLQALVTNLDRSPYLGRLALCRMQQGSIKKGQQVAWCRADGSRPTAPTPGRSRAGASCSWPFWSRPCGGRASSSPSASRRWSPERSTERSTNPWSASPSMYPKTTSAP